MKFFEPIFKRLKMSDRSADFAHVECELKTKLKALSCTYIPIENESTLLKVRDLFISDITDEYHEIESPNCSGIKLYYLALHYKIVKKDINNMKTNLFMAIEMGYSPAMVSLGDFYHSQKDYGQMMTYYLRAVEQKNVRAMIKLAGYYINIEKDEDLMIKYLLMAVKLEDADAMTRLGVHYYLKKKYSLMEEYYLMAIDLRYSDAMYSFALYYKTIDKNYQKMIEYFVMSSELGNVSSMIELGLYYQLKEIDNEKTKEYYSMVQKKLEIDIANVTNIHLGRFYYYYGIYQKDVEKDETKMKEYWFIAVKLGNLNAKHSLSDYYNKPENIKTDDNYLIHYLKIIGNEYLCPHLKLSKHLIMTCRHYR